MLFLLGQVVELHLAIAVFSQIFQRLCVELIAFLLQLRRFGHNGSQLLGGGHVGLVFPLFLFGLALLKVCTLLQRAHAHHEKLVQIGAVNSQKLDAFAQRDVFVLAQRQNAAVEIQPAQFAVDKDRFITHSKISPYSSLTTADGVQLSPFQRTYACPAHESTIARVMPDTCAASSTCANGPCCAR